MCVCIFLGGEPIIFIGFSEGFMTHKRMQVERLSQHGPEGPSRLVREKGPRVIYRKAASVVQLVI